LGWSGFAKRKELNPPGEGILNQSDATRIAAARSERESCVDMSIFTALCPEDACCFAKFWLKRTMSSIDFSSVLTLCNQLFDLDANWKFGNIFLFASVSVFQQLPPQPCACTWSKIVVNTFSGQAPNNKRIAIAGFPTICCSRLICWLWNLM
jgi:hypothetical protein